MPSPESPELTILIPCLNEQGGIADCVRRGQRFLERNKIHGEILIADNNSDDCSAGLAKEAGGRVIHVEDRGYGRAIIAGIEMARGQFIIMGDADGAHDLSSLEPFWEKLQNGYDFVIGNRFTPSFAGPPTPFLHRYIGNPLLSGIGKLFFSSPVGDFHCGLRAFSAKSVRALSLQCPGMELASEMVVKAIQRNMRITEVPVMQHPEIDPSRSSHLRTWRDGWRHLILLLTLSPRWLFLYPGCILSLAGILAMTIALMDVSENRFGLYTLMLGSGSFTCGLQIIIFSLLAKIFYENIGLTDETQWLEKFQKHRVFVTILSLGFTLLLLGGAGSAWSVFIWAQMVEIDHEMRSRVLIPSITLLITGLQIIFSGFLLTLLSTQKPVKG